MSRTRIERETVIIYNEFEQTATVWSASDKVINKLKKFGFHPDDGKFIIPKKLISIRKPAKARKAMSPEDRAKARERLQNARMARG